MSSLSFLTPVRAALLVAVAAVAVYANSLGNGFAFDDTWVVESNPVVLEGRFDRLLDTPYWPQAAPGTGNWRPVTIGSFALEWHAWDGEPLGFHAVSVAAHAGVSLLVFALLLQLVGVMGALVGGLVFAVHPVHVEAVANVVGRSELYACGAVVAAVLLHWRGADWTGWRRGARLAGIAGLYALGLGSKEMAVTLPGILLAVDLTVRHGQGGPVDRLRRELPVYGVLAAVLATYLVLRWSALGAVTGESAAAGLRSLDTGERILTALTVWPHYLRLMLAPADLSMDYQPGVLLPAAGVDLRVAAGALILLGVVAGSIRLARREPVVALGLAWFLITVLPVSNLVVRSDILLAERTLYLPSVGLSLALAGLVPVLRRSADARALRMAGAVALLAFVGLSVRTVTRNPTWLDTFTALETLAREHPESYMSWRARALGQERVGELERAAASYGTALELAPDDYVLTVEAGAFFSRAGRPGRAEELFREAVELVPDYPAAWRRWAEHLLRTGQGRRAHATALDGLARVGADRELWALVSESYVAKGDLEAALRARRAAVSLPGTTRNAVLRLAQLLDAMERPDEARAARARADTLPEAPPPEMIR